MEDRVIYLNDVIMRCLLKWRLAIICIILGVCALSMFGVYRQKKEIAELEEAANQPAADGEIPPATIAEAEAALSEAELSEVYLARDRYLTYQNNYNSLYDYYSGSIIGQLDATSVDTMRLSYLIDTHFKVTYPEIEAQDYTDSVFAYIQGNFVDQELCSSVSRIVGERLEEKYVSQLIGVWRNGNILYVSVKGRSREECAEMAEIVKTRVDTLANEAKRVIHAFDIKFLREKYTRSPDTGLMDNQYTQSTRMAAYQNAMNSILNYMSADQRTLLKMLTMNALKEAAAEEEQAEIGAAEPETEESVPVEIPDIDYIQVKFILAGAILGLILAVCMVLLGIMIRGRLITQNDIRDALKIPRLGTWNTGKPARGINKWIINTFGGDGVQFSPEESRGMAVAGIRLMSEKNGYKNLYITGTSNDEMVNTEAEQITEALGAAGVSAQFGRSILYDPESLEAMSEKDAVVIIEKIDVSKNSEIEEEVAVCTRQQVPVMGYIAIR